MPQKAKRPSSPGRFGYGAKCFELTATTGLDGKFAVTPNFADASAQFKNANDPQGRADGDFPHARK